MSSKIVVGIDGSPGSARALEAATDVAKRYDASVVLCHVVERIAAKGDMAPLHADEPEVKAAVEKQAAGLRDQGIDTDVRTEAIVLGGGYVNTELRRVSDPRVERPRPRVG